MKLTIRTYFHKTLGNVNSFVMGSVGDIKSSKSDRSELIKEEVIDRPEVAKQEERLPAYVNIPMGIALLHKPTNMPTTKFIEIKEGDVIVSEGEFDGLVLKYKSRRHVAYLSFDEFVNYFKRKVFGAK